MGTTTLTRDVFKQSRVLEYFTEDALNRQMGVTKEVWPLMLVKELIDNALDACESTRITPLITVTLEDDVVTIADNGPGLPSQTIEGSLDYLVRVSDKVLYVSPSRGQLGNALKLLWAAPFVACGGAGRVRIMTPEASHEVHVSLNRLEQKPDIKHNVGEALVKNGTTVEIHWPGIASYFTPKENTFSYRPNLTDLLHTYRVLNPHVTITLNGGTGRESQLGLAKWTTDQPTSAHWYTPERLRDLIAGLITGGNELTVRDFVGTFDNLSGTARRKAVSEACNLQGATLKDLILDGDISMERVSRLLAAMQGEAKAVKPERLGVIGRDHFKAVFEEPESVRYASRKGFTGEGLPFVLEVALGYRDEREPGRVMTGLNFSPTLRIPFSELSAQLGENRIDWFDPVEIAVHLASPLLEFTDPGKTHLRLPQEVGEALTDAVAKVAKDHKKAKRRAERLSNHAHNHLRRVVRQQHYGLKEAAHEVMQEAYLAASGGGQLPANARQVMYAARPRVLELTGGKWYSDDRSFTSGVLPEFLDEYPELTASWDIVFDARGMLREPHTARRVDLGTLQVRNYIGSWSSHVTAPLEIDIRYQAPTSGPKNRYAYALFIEKEGFYPLLDATRISKRFGVATMSTKGMPTTAARQLVDKLSIQGVTILVARDFDKAGFSIVSTLKSDTTRFRFKRTPNVHDLGLRLSDIEEMDLQREPVKYGKTDPRFNLFENGATPKEVEVLCNSRTGREYHGERVELNSMTADQFIHWLERKFAEVGVKKVTPDKVTLAAAYKEAFRRAQLQRLIDNAIKSLPEEALAPENLESRIERLTAISKELTWDDALWNLAHHDVGAQLERSALSLTDEPSR